jgi:HEAT repeat protein
MVDCLEEQVRERFLDRLDVWWNPEDPRLDFGSAALPFFIDAFGKEHNPERRHQLIEAIWQFRDAAALPTLCIALQDETPEVWKESLDGFVRIGGSAALDALRETKAAIPVIHQTQIKHEWVDEAIEQIEKGIEQQVGRGEI